CPEAQVARPTPSRASRSPRRNGCCACRSLSTTTPVPVEPSAPWRRFAARRTAIRCSSRRSAPTSCGRCSCLAQSSPDPLPYGTPGVGTSAHLIAELLCARTGMRLLHVPYSSSPPSYKDLMAGRLALAFSLVSGVQGHVMAGRMKAIAVTSRHRLASLPDVPTVYESGIADFDVTSWYGLMAPHETSLAVREAVYRAFASA